jgi:hypothetical protein
MKAVCGVIDDEALIVAEELQPALPPIHFFEQGGRVPGGSRRSGWTGIGRSSFATLREIRHHYHAQSGCAAPKPAKDSKIHVKTKTGESKSERSGRT